MSKSPKLSVIKEMIETAEASLKTAKQLLNELLGGEGALASKGSVLSNLNSLDAPVKEGDDTIVEGVFDGEKMIDKLGTNYPVPANYASKSKLLPGDTLKLTIKPDGTFLYKQIGPVERKRLVGTLTYEDGQYRVIASGKAYKVLLASVTYYKGEVGDKVTIITPQVLESEWAAIENILPKNEDGMEISES